MSYTSRAPSILHHYKRSNLHTHDRRIAISEAEAVQFGCNAINVGADVILHAAPSSSVPSRLRHAGYRVAELPLGEFIKAAGSAKSLVLRLSDSAITHRTCP